MKTLIIDNYDSFTYNLYQQVARLSSKDPIVIKNDELSIAEIRQLPINNIILSPGPGRPDIPSDIGICDKIFELLDMPVLGVCLGMQTIAHHFGGAISTAPEQMHGRTSKITHNTSELFQDIPPLFNAMRYHSLVVNSSLPECLIPIATTDDNAIVMAIQHRTRPFYGIQFHPESIGSDCGDQLIQNFLRIATNSHSNFRKSNVSPRSVTNNIDSKNTDKKTKSNYTLITKELPEYIEASLVFETLYKDSEQCYWLDSSLVNNDTGRYSFMGDTTGSNSYSLLYTLANNEITVNKNNTLKTSNEDIFHYLQNKLNIIAVDSNKNSIPFIGGYVGWLGYELNRITTSEDQPPSNTPDAGFIFSDRFIAFDHIKNKITLMAISTEQNKTASLEWFDIIISKLKNITTEDPTTTSPSEFLPQFTLSKSRSNYIDLIKKAQDKIRAGESYEICLTNQITTEIECDGYTVYKTLRYINQAPYSCYMRLGDMEIISSSPEQFLKINNDRIVSSKPIKGTISRNKNNSKDEANKQKLKESTKELAENVMIVDLLRNDLGRVCEIGSISVPKLFDIESYSTVHQLVSTVQGKLDENQDAIDCIKAAFPGGSMTGAPKTRTLSILQELEKIPRGVYSGALGYLSLNGQCDLSIVIRTIFKRGKIGTIGIGGAITALSRADAEFDETILKANAVLKAISTTQNDSSS